MASSSSSAQERSVASLKVYDAFISHRGPDVKETLAKQLYDLLKERGCRTFLDREEIEGGDSITSAIKNGICSSVVQIAIFSKGYAESSWCLDELVLMLQQTDALFIPVFYDVQPWELRHIQNNKKSQYAAAFRDYERKGRYLDKLGAWKEALARAADISGYELSQYQKDLCEKIVSRVLQEMGKRKPLHVANYPVGLAELVQDFENSCSKTVGMVGIFGLGGSGKTTLARELFNRKRSSYSASCFLSDVRESYADRDLHSLQSQLLENLFHDKWDCKNVYEGIAGLKYNLSSVQDKDLHFLIILDDIDHQDQLDALIPKGMLTCNSLVILTTRDQSMLRDADIHYKMKGMDKDNAKELFCSHAFGVEGCRYPRTAYEKLIESFVEFCGGLPLALKVLGAHVYGRDEHYWELELEKVQKIQPEDIMQRLKISFDRLDREEKQIFLDIACLFNKKQIRNLKSNAITIWKASGWSAEHAVQTLQDRCLLEVSGRGDFQYFEMHNHLRDLGRQIADELSPPRLWRPQLLRSMEAKGFQRILAETNRGRCFNSFWDSSLGMRITFFIAETDLLWLEMNEDGRPFMNIPSWIPLRKLHLLHIENVEEFWSTFQQQLQTYTQLPLQLRELRITKCFGVSSLPEGFGALQRLEHLELTFCPMLASLPPDFGDLRNLRHLDLSNCEQLEELPHSFEQLIYLEYIRLSGCTMLSSLPLRFGDLRNLRHLDLSNCEQLEELPHSFQQLTGLKYLTLSCCWKLKLSVDMLKNITELQYLGLTGCNLLEELPRLVTVFPLQLRELRITRCFLGSFLPEEFCTLKSLEILELSCCPILSSLPPRFGDLRNLRYLDLSCCLKLNLKLDMLENITTLEYLNLTRLHEVKELPYHTINQASLTRLFVEGTSISEVPTDIGELRNLEELRIGSPMLTSLPSSLGKLSCLTTLLIDGCPQLQDLPQSLCNLDLLKQVRIRASGLRELPFCAGSSNFEVTGQQAEASYSGLNLRPRVTENCLQSIWNALKALWIERRVTEHGILETDFPTKLPAGIQTMSLVANPRLMEIRILPQSLTIFEIRVCKKLKNLSGIVGLVKLRRLEICSCPELDELPSLADLASLQEFKIQGCPKVKIIQGVEHCTSLQILTAEVPVIQSLENVEGLRRVNLTSYTISDLKPCILLMKKCPREMMIRGRVTHFVKPIVDSLSLTNLSVLLLDKDSDWDNITGDLFSGAFLWYEEEEESNNEESGSSSVNVSAQKVVQVAVCREGSSAFPEYLVERRFGSNPNFRQRRAMLATGEDGRVVAAFHKLIALLE